MKYRPLVSVVIPFHNASNTLHRCLNSVIAQTYRPLEVILVDDASSDNSYRIARCIADTNQDPEIKFKLLHFTQNRGVAAARNAALNTAKGEYLYSIDADDYVDAPAIADYVDASSYGKYDMIASGLIYEYPDKKSFPATYSQGYVLSLHTARLDTLHFSLHTKLIRTSSLKECDPFAEGQNCWEDLGAVVRVLASGGSVKTLPTAYYHYIQTAKSITRNPSNPLQIPLQRIEVTRRLERWMIKKDLHKQYSDFLDLLKIFSKANLLRPSTSFFRHPIRHLRLWSEIFPEVNHNIYTKVRVPRHYRVFLQIAHFISLICIRKQRKSDELNT